MSGDIFGDSDDETPGAPIESDGLAESIAMSRTASGDAKADDTAGDYLRERLKLLELQIKHFDEDVGLRRLGERLKLSIQALFILTGVFVVIGLGALVWRAANSENVVVDTFDAPPDLAQKGETGRVVASAVLDELTKLQAATRSLTVQKSLANAWSGDIRIEIPDTGVSLGELARTLRDSLGHDVHVGGSLVETGSSLALTVRGDGILAKSFTGTDLPKLAAAAAEYVYGQAEPVRYAYYLIDANRFADAETFAQNAYPHLPESERVSMANVWANAIISQGRTQEAVGKYRLAVSLDPRFWRVWGNLIGAVGVADGEEASWKTGQEMVTAAKAAPSSNQPTPTNYLNYHPLLQDWQGELADLNYDANSGSGAGNLNTIDGPALADAAAMLHDWFAVDRYLAASDPADPTTKIEKLLVQVYKALDRDDYAGAIPPFLPVWQQWQSDASIRYTYTDNPCLLGYAYAMTGQTTEADAVFEKTGRFLRCYALRADGIEHSGDWNGAVAAYRAAIRLAPDLPFAYDRWGLALERHHDWNGATAAFRDANQHGPHWAEPLKHWGDLLMREGKRQDALAKYNEALPYAAHWDALIAARAAAGGT